MMTLPTMAQSAANEELQQEFENLCCQTREQIARLHLFLSPLPIADHKQERDQPAYEKHETADPSVMDCMLIAEARKKQHAKIALYSTVCVWAHQLGLKDMEKSLTQNLQEEEVGSERLLHLARGVTNPTA